MRVSRAGIWNSLRRNTLVLPPHSVGARYAAYRLRVKGLVAVTVLSCLVVNVPFAVSWSELLLRLRSFLPAAVNVRASLSEPLC